ncbi:hypothetical protein [Pandoraea terrigena]|uniref:Uncharacterized protein n=1 Tax=Pandoraea terrigena TaxID=2508292 RepID=A0A5E4YNV2_9BURK|nr:hypothetical protein [Pandoraea terrigena]VVE50038.1 hypothetical protein PTE31013_04665 [Pandoraea terrigena]
MRTYTVSFFGGVAIGVLAAAFWRFPPQGSGELASWVQAFGSIAAIAAAGYFPVRHARVQEANRQRRLLSTISQIATMTESELKAFRFYMRTPQEAADYRFNGAFSRWAALSVQVGALSVYELDSVAVRGHLLSLGQSINTIEGLLRQMPSGDSASGNNPWYEETRLELDLHLMAIELAKSPENMGPFSEG